MKTIQLFQIICILLIAGLFAAGCAQEPSPPVVTTPWTAGTGSTGTSTTGEDTAASQELLKFKDTEELRAFLAQRSAGASSTVNARGAMGEMALFSSKAMAAPTAAAGAMADASFEQGAGDYSQTNVQVEGVDEADFVKNDDRYIYMIAGKDLVIVDAFDAKNARIVSRTEINRSNDYYYYGTTSRQLFINGNRLALFVSSYERALGFYQYDIAPHEDYKQMTYVYLYDITDKAKPRLINTYKTPGAYYQSRLIGDVIYMVTQDYAAYSKYLESPVITDSHNTLVRPEVYYFDNPEDNYQFNTITSINIGQDRVVDSKTLLLGYSNTLMVSENNIYIAYQKQQYWCWWGGCRWQEDDNKVRFYTIVLPLLKGELKADVNEISSLPISDEEKWARIADKLSLFYQRLQSDEDLANQYEPMFTEIEDALSEYDTKKQLERSGTVIHKIAIDNGKIDYRAKGEVPGYLLNQFSLDEYQGNLRVATTVSIWTKKRIVNNNVYVLGSSMERIGAVEGIAPDEQIYSTRFLGDRLYMVTFRQTDPFFVIDLSDPTQPNLAGKLKLPGFSNYLHPYDENHIIGIGKGTGSDELDSTGIKGVKIALFDVTDMNNPELVDSVEIGDVGTDSAALHDHKAFLFSKSKGLLVIPVTEVTERMKTGYYGYTQSLWHGAYAFKVTASGFTKIGKVTHASTSTSYYSWYDQATVFRSLYMDNNLYTISNKYIKINDLANELESLGTVELPYSEEYAYRVY